MVEEVEIAFELVYAESGIEHVVVEDHRCDTGGKGVGKTVVQCLRARMNSVPTGVRPCIDHMHETVDI